MKNLIFFCTLAIVLFPACGNDDDGGSGGNLGDPGDLVLEITWDAADADFDLALLGPGGQVIGGGFISGTSTGITSSPDILTGPGTETIRFDDVAMDGSYFISLDLVTADAARDVRLEISSSGTTRVFNESMLEDQTINYSFTKTGGTLNF